ncbi:MAG: magnesium transporter CorA family protein [Parcubacteria group bacterium]|nr:magnesium transporter CorA family protein [Parcubacteria group bacterium]
MMNNVHKTEFSAFTWHNVTDNGEQEIRYLRDKFGFESADLQVVASPPLRPKLDLNPAYLFIVLPYPVHERKTSVVTTSELDLFLMKNAVVTVHKNEIQALRDISQRMEAEPRFREKYSRANPLKFTLDMIETLDLSLYPMLDHFSWDIDAIDKILFTGRERELVGSILAIKRNIVAVRKSLGGQKDVIEEMQEHAKEYVGAKALDRATEAQFRNIRNLSKDLWVQMENHMATIGALQQTNESLISFRLNDIMKTLTMLSLVVFPLTLLAAIFGMNTTGGMPFVESMGGFWRVIAIMLSGMLFMLYWFKRHRWI